MERSQNPRTPRGRRVRFVDTAPHDYSRSRPDVHPLQMDLDSAHRRAERLQGTVDELARQRSDLLINRTKLCKTLHNYKWQIDRLEGLLKLRENEFKTEFKKSYQTISSFEAQVSSLQKQLQSKNEELEKIQLLRKQENEEMTARLESEKNKVQESAVLQNDLQQKLKMMEQQLLQKDKQIMDLQRNNHDLSHKLTEASAEFQSNNAWQTKYNALQEKFTEEMVTKQQSCEATTEQLVQEKKKVEELQLKMKNEKTEKDKKDQEMKNKGKQEIDRLSQKLTETTSELRSCRVEFLQSYKAWQGEYNALEKKFKEQLIQKQQDSEKTSKLVEEEKKSLLQKEEDTERSQTERVTSNEGTVVTSGIQTEEEKKKKGFLSCIHKKKSGDSQPEGGEAPCCTTQVAQQFAQQ
ncbi:GRIP domain-containing protein RUD3-like [Larimichthys crocea]|uniref:GRIP domain-containing protein RUD3-like n=1 Tax=Larimichthys crocea TaxID=215358 RepID=UPI000F603E8B|nr:GRIP domain-containing protein RUD3-like [Larimichthys crocea]